MTQSDSGGPRILGSLRSIGGRGLVRMEDRFEAEIDAVWSAVTDPRRLSDWYGKVEGELRPGGTFRIYVEADDWDGTGRVETCEAPRRLVVTTRESEESWRKGQGVPPFDARLEATLTPAGDETDLVLEVRGLPLEPLAFFGVGWQILFERLGEHLAGRAVGDTEPRWDELIPCYQALGVDVAQ